MSLIVLARLEAMRRDEIFSASGRRTAFDEGDAHMEEDRVFLRGVMAALESQVTAGSINDLVIVAPPRALGILRRLKNSHVRAVTRAEIAHDYIKLPLYEIENHLQNMQTYQS